MVCGSMREDTIVNEPAGRECLFVQNFQEQMGPLAGIAHLQIY